MTHSSCPKPASVSSSPRKSAIEYCAALYPWKLHVYCISPPLFSLLLLPPTCPPFPYLPPPPSLLPSLPPPPLPLSLPPSPPRPVAYQDPSSTLLSSLFTTLLVDALNEYAYYAEIAGIQYEISINPYGIVVSETPQPVKLCTLNSECGAQCVECV